MTKASLVLMLGLAAGMMFTATPKAHAGVIVGVRVGAPVYVQPVRPYAYIAPRPLVAVNTVPVYRRYYVASRPEYRRYWRARRERFVRRGYGRR